MTVREMVKAAQKELLAGDPTPERARALNAQLSALLGNCNEAIRVADAAYAVALLALFDVEQKANRAKLRGETTPEYQAKREARDTKDVLIEMVRTLRQNMRSLDEEMRLQR